MATSDENASKAKVIRQINAGLGPREIDLSIDTCPKIPANELAAGAINLLTQSIVAEIFHEAGVQGNQASQCWDEMANKIMLGKLFQFTTLKQYVRFNTVNQRLEIIKKLQNATKKHVCMPAPELACVIAATVFRKLQLNPVRNEKHKNDLIEFFGKLNGMRWLSIAIKVHDKVKGRPFVVELDPEVSQPLIRFESIGDQRHVAIVTTKEPPSNIYEAEMRKVIRQMNRRNDDEVTNHSPSHCDEPRTSIEKVESQTTPLDSIPTNIPQQSPNIDSQQEQGFESQHHDPPNSATIRHHARQMKQFGKRIASPDQDFVRRVRRDMREFANVTDQKEREMELEREAMKSRLSSSTAGESQVSNSLDLFGRYKLLWKSSLEENGCISDSLRKLVHHDCDSFQVFYLNETEKEFLDGMARDRDGGLDG